MFFSLNNHNSSYSCLTHDFLFYLINKSWSQTVAQGNDLSFSLFHSPVKFVGGDCWPRGPTLTGSPSLLPPGSSVEQPMEVSTVEQMDTSSGVTSEASAPLPIRHPSGINAGPYKKQAYPMNSKRPEHLRMNL